MKEIIVNDYPKSALAEEINTIKTNLKFSAVNNKHQVILITSSIVGEGKSFIAANLATSYANSKKKVLLMDCDLRKGRQHKIFNLDQNNGLSNFLVLETKVNSIGKYIKQTEISNLSILPSGTIPPNPIVLLENSKMVELLTLLRKEYNIIILDGVPVNMFTDSLLLSKLADNILVVAEARKTTKEMLLNTKDALNAVNASVTGVILNQVKLKKNKHYRSEY